MKKTTALARLKKAGFKISGSGGAFVAQRDGEFITFFVNPGSDNTSRFTYKGSTSCAPTYGMSLSAALGKKSSRRPARKNPGRVANAGRRPATKNPRRKPRKTAKRKPVARPKRTARRNPSAQPKTHLFHIAYLNGRKKKVATGEWNSTGVGIFGVANRALNSAETMRQPASTRAVLAKIYLNGRLFGTVDNRGSITQNARMLVVKS